jgi:hypothetical protein
MVNERYQDGEGHRCLWIAQQVLSIVQGSGEVGCKSLSKMTKRIGNPHLPNQLHIKKRANMNIDYPTLWQMD